jgi:hypothetical protein
MKTLILAAIRCSLMFTAVTASLLTSTAQATVINFHGTINSVEGTPPPMPQVGDSFSGTLVFDPNHPFNEDGVPNVSLDIYIATMLGIFHTALEPEFSFYIGGFGPSIAGESMTQEETMAISFLNAELSSFVAGVIFWDECIGCDFLGSVEASGIAVVAESASTFTLFALSFAGVAMLLWIQRSEKIRAYLTSLNLFSQ